MSNVEAEMSNVMAIDIHLGKHDNSDNNDYDDVDEDDADKDDLGDDDASKDEDEDDEVDCKLKLWRMKGLKVSVPTLCFNDSYHNRNSQFDKIV